MSLPDFDIVDLQVSSLKPEIGSLPVLSPLPDEPVEISFRTWTPARSPLPVSSFRFQPPPEWTRPGKRTDERPSRDNNDSRQNRSKEIHQHPSPDTPRKQTRIRPPQDVIRPQDRLFYLLQPPLESIFDRKSIRFKYEPFSYQYEGIAFLYPRQYGILADEMGLGKTMQAISAIRLLLHAREVHEVLLVCPKPLATNWIREFATWAPEIPVETVGGDQSKRKLQWLNRQIPVKIANYELLNRDIELIRENGKHFDLVVLDEAQRIKNPRSTTSQTVKSLSRTRNWALTGTPIENSVDDLAGIFDFLSAGLIRPGLSPRKMAHSVRDSILRRTKDQVLDDMPPKFINDVYLELNENQRQAYELAEEEGVIQLNDLGSQLTVQHVFELVLRLKQICNFDPCTGESTKLEKLESDLEEVVASGQKAIVFSQWVKTLDQIAERLQRFRPLQYHGRIPSAQRDPILDEFKNSPDRPVILMSYGTGSVGLNLQFCRYVFLFDRWWNPAVEDQAINRAHRLGSAGSVTVNRMICCATIEERIHDVLEEKRELFQEVLGETGRAPRGLSQSELFGLFRLEIPRKKTA